MPHYEREAQFVPWLKEKLDSKEEISQGDFAFIVTAAVDRFGLTPAKICDGAGLRGGGRKKPKPETVVENWRTGNGPVSPLRRKVSQHILDKIEGVK